MNAVGATLLNLRFLRWSNFLTTSAFSLWSSLKIYPAGKVYCYFAEVIFEAAERQDPGRLYTLKRYVLDALDGASRFDDCKTADLRQMEHVC